jgi:hypothetical protein
MFKTGDRVRVLVGEETSFAPVEAGTEGIIKCVIIGIYFVLVDNDPQSWSYQASELELVEEA